MKAEINVLEASTEIADYIIKNQDVGGKLINVNDEYTDEGNELFMQYYDDIFSIITNISYKLITE